MMKEKKVRTAITKESFYYFFHFYYAHYVQYATADFQKEIMNSIQLNDRDNLFIVAFRNSGKSTLITTAYPIWATLGKQQKKFVTIFCQTQIQAKLHMMNIRRELENNELLKNDLGPFSEDSDQWGAQSIVFSNTNARITVASVEQSIRGFRHYEYRPDLIICDDVEDTDSVKTRDGRNKTYQWLKGEVIPAGDINTRLIIVGNLLHEDSLLMRLKEEVEKDTINGKFLFFPLINDNGDSLWPGKYKTQQDLENERKKVGNEIVWQREYLLNIVPDEDQVIYREWIQYYDEVPFNEKDEYGYTKTSWLCIGVDLAISEKTTADYTAMVPCLLTGTGKDSKFYILPNIVNKRMDFKNTIDTCKTLSDMYRGTGIDLCRIMFIVENVAYQDALPQQLRYEHIGKIRTINPGRSDKRTRLNLTAPMIQNGQILFPRQGAEKLIDQIVNFGIEKYDDLADAFSNIIISILDDRPKSAGMIRV